MPSKVNGQSTLVAALKARFPGKLFTGNCPTDFRFAVRCEYGHPDIEFLSLFPKGHKKVDGWLAQAQTEADGVKKEPLLCWRKARHPWLAFTKWKHVAELHPCMRYRDFGAVGLATLLTLPDAFWFTMR